MKRSIITDEISQDFARACDLAVSHGFEGVEIRSAWDTPPHEFSDAQIQSIRLVTKERGLEMSGFCPPAFKCAIPATRSEEASAISTIDRSFAVAAKLGDLPVRFFPFYRDGDPDPTSAGAVAARLLEQADIPSGVHIRFENGMRTNAPTLRHLKTFLAQGDILSSAGVLWDPGNSVFSGYASDPFRDDFEYLADAIEHVHIKDPDGQDSYVRLGEGSLPWIAIFEALGARGFSGHLSLETHWRLDRVLLPEERDQPWSEAISLGGPEASAECMQILNDMLGIRK